MTNNNSRFTRDDYDNGSLLILVNGWRACVYDKRLGILVMDVTADFEGEAKGKARSIAESQLGAAHVESVIVMRHTEMPASWFRKTLSRRSN